MDPTDRLIEQLECPRQSTDGGGPAVQPLVAYHDFILANKVSQLSAAHFLQTASNSSSHANLLPSTHCILAHCTCPLCAVICCVLDDCHQTEREFGGDKFERLVTALVQHRLCADDDWAAVEVVSCVNHNPVPTSAPCNSFAALVRTSIISVLTRATCTPLLRAVLRDEGAAAAGSSSEAA